MKERLGPKVVRFDWRAVEEQLGLGLEIGL